MEVKYKVQNTDYNNRLSEYITPFVRRTPSFQLRLSIHVSFWQRAVLVRLICAAWCSEIGSLTSLMHLTQVHPLTTKNQFHCTRLFIHIPSRLFCAPKMKGHIVPPALAKTMLPFSESIQVKFSESLSKYELLTQVWFPWKPLLAF